MDAEQWLGVGLWIWACIWMGKVHAIADHARGHAASWRPLLHTILFAGAALLMKGMP